MTQPLEAAVTGVDNIAKSAVISGTATPGAKVSIGNKEADVNSAGAWSMTVTGLNNGVNKLTAIQKIGGAEHDRKPVDVTIVEGGTFVGVDQGPIDLERGASKQVPLIVQNNEARANTTGTVTVNAPAGTTFDAQTRVDASWRVVNNTSRWAPVTTIPFTNGRLSNSNKTITFDVNWPENHGANEQYRYMLNVTADANAAAGNGEMGFTFQGDSSKGDFRATGKTTTTIDTVTAADITATSPSGEAGETSSKGTAKVQAEQVVGPMTLTAPTGTTFADVKARHSSDDVEQGNYRYTFNGARTTVTIDGPDNGSGAHWGTANQYVDYTLNIPASAEPGTITGGTAKVIANGNTLAEGTFGVEVVSSVAPIVVQTPANGSTASDKRPVFSGTGDEGATIEIKGSTGRVVATTTVKDGKWSVPAGFDLVDGSYALIATQTPLDGEKTTAPINFDVKAMVPVTLTAPAIGSDVSTPNPVFEGRGTPGATVVVKGTYGSVLATTEVKADGTWTVPSAVALATGSYAGTATQTVDGKNTTAPFRFTVGQSLTPVTLTTPEIGAEIPDTKPVFTGEGQPGATVEVKGTYGTLLATAVVQNDGTWEVTSDVTLANGTYAGKAWQTVNGKTTTADFRFTVAQSITPVTLDTPAIGDEITDTKPVFTGEGQPGATVEVKGTYGTLLATAVVQNDGTWEATSDVTLARGSYAGKAWQTVNGKTTSADFRFSVVAPMIPVSLTAPAQDAVVATPNPVFSGKGTPDADITVTGASGTQLAAGKVRSNGEFDLTSTIALGAGSYSGTVRQDAGGKVTTAGFQFRIAFTAVTLESPAIGEALTNGTPVFSGKGTPKAPLVIKGSGGTTLATGSVKDDGSWSLTSTVTLPAGRYTGTVQQSLPGSDTTAPFSFTVS
ncbi:hypothetical protein KK092_10710 [Curtobacterium flaccumfaciens pv. flaccumfaciens]|uniref:Ig-like domain-containing protein n=1 Tax=Curtobacterium flaccumfaciens TaxID=2035 RepID=UPI001BDEB071|nr:Ig-like domain-containing protein [Curtobacterium flaccumfaciens]MBT1669855.1 hypothetical protein [Curtobacterium flaccumfaciens pv. flaccumfaciens]